MRRRQSTITEEFSPTFRRRIKPNYLSLSLPGAFKLTQVENSDHKEESDPAESIDVQRHMEKAKENFDRFVQNYEKIHSIIDQVDEIIRKRMEAHEEGLLTVVRSEIDKMQADCRKVVEQYNRMIEAKNKETQIYNLKNEVQYFRHAALKYYEHNRQLVQENKELRHLVRNKDSIIEDLNGAAKKVAKKYLKQKAIGQRKEKEQQAENSALWTKINNLTQQNFQIGHKNNEVIEITQPPKTQLNKAKEPSLFSHRYSSIKRDDSTNLTKEATRKKLRTELASTSFNQESSLLTLKVRNSGKSRSFWKFQAKS